MWPLWGTKLMLVKALVTGAFSLVGEVGRPSVTTASEWSSVRNSKTGLRRISPR